MVFHEIETITDVISGHRVITYYIEGDLKDKWEIHSSVEFALEILGKKNDDFIVFKVRQNTQQFKQFQELYKPEITSPIALFVVNPEGIPLICEQICREDDVYQALDSICSYCDLNPVSKSEISKSFACDPGNLFADNKNNVNTITNGLNQKSPHLALETPSHPENELSMPKLRSNINRPRPNESEVVQSTSTVLQIRLPDGTKENQKFDKHALLQEVYDFIRNKFNIKDFDLKTYNRSAFSATDYEKPLEDLDLTPNGVIIIVYKNVVPFKSNGNISRMIQVGFWIFYAKVNSTLRYVQGLLYTFWNSFFSSSTRSSREPTNDARASGSGGTKSFSRPISKKSTSRFGNIHTLRRSDDSDDENNRYNGNSTQQK